MQRNVYLYAPNFVSGLGSVTTVWLPYTVGCLWSYAVTNAEVADNYRLSGLGLLRDPIDQVVRSLDNPAVCGFSTYVWNEQYNLQLAQAIKQRWPDCLIVFGGPNVPNQEQDYRAWRAAAPWIDVTIRYEGEQAINKDGLRLRSYSLPTNCWICPGGIVQDFLFHDVVPSCHRLGALSNLWCRGMFARTIQCQLHRHFEI